jgi:hypothetical protein
MALESAHAMLGHSHVVVDDLLRVGVRVRVRGQGARRGG